MFNSYKAHSKMRCVDNRSVIGIQPRIGLLYRMVSVTKSPGYWSYNNQF